FDYQAIEWSINLVDGCYLKSALSLSYKELLNSNPEFVEDNDLNKGRKCMEKSNLLL
ncbi:1329_t:CDS:2, partial [Funneliformis mosseae]